MINNWSVTMQTSRHQPWHHRGLALLVWTSPFTGLDMFFPLGVLFAYPANRYLRQTAWSSVFIQLIVFLGFYPVKILSLMSVKMESLVSGWMNLVTISAFPFLTATAVYLYFSQRKTVIRHNWQARIRKKRYLIPALLFPLLLAGYYTSQNEILAKYEPVTFVNDLVLYFYLSVFAAIQTLSGNRIHKLFRRLYLSLELQKKRSVNTLKYAKWRENLLPGWGHIFLENYWKGFPLLFLFLLLVLFTGVLLSGYIDPVFGINFMGSFGLKFGTGDKKFFEYSAYPLFVVPLFLLAALYTYSGYSLRSKTATNRGLATGFLNNLHFSLLIHFILLTIVFLIPATIRRNDSKKDKPKSSPPRFYTIDTSIPDDITRLNGGVTGIQEKYDQGITIKQQKTSEDQGRVAGKTTKPRGKQVPPTYSNYISAKMRAPGFFSDYWARAPYPYSCVVSYTISADGDIFDIEIVESSGYPDQDRLTIELIESMSPLLPYPDAKDSIRVTELFWNGPIDPSSMPTPMQKEMVNMFDGRYLEEDP